MKRTIWIINGWTTNIGSWEIEIFTNKEDALDMFEIYKQEYNAVCRSCDYVAECDDGYGWFSLDERELTFHE